MDGVEVARNLLEDAVSAALDAGMTGREIVAEVQYALENAEEF